MAEEVKNKIRLVSINRNLTAVGGELSLAAFAVQWTFLTPINVHRILTTGQFINAGATLGAIAPVTVQFISSSRLKQYQSPPGFVYQALSSGSNSMFFQVGNEEGQVSFEDEPLYFDAGDVVDIWVQANHPAGISAFAAGDTVQAAVNIFWS